MNRRAAFAVLVIALWLAGVAALVRREVLRDPSEQLAMAGLLITPGSDFYAVRYEGEHVGFSSFTVDTTESGIELNDYMVLERRTPGGAPLRMARRLRASATRNLKLERFQLDEQAGENVRTVFGTVEGDSTLVLQTRAQDGTTTEERLKLDHPVLPSSAVTFALALSRSPRVGRTYDFATLDALSMQPTLLRMRVIADSVLVVADSAAKGSDGRWIAARSDTVRAWRVEDAQGGRLRMWVDVDGRIISREFESGLTEQRTAYEMAYLNWPGNRFVRRAALTGQDGNRSTP